MADLERAIQIAVQAHQGQKDKNGAPYILHPLRVMLRMDNDLERMAAVLHDVVEDSSWTLADLRKEGFPDPVIAAVNHLSRRENESYDDFIRRIRPQALAAKIKLADLEDNMNLTRLKQFTQQEKERVAKYHSAWLMIKKSPPGS